jgi:hypothetical protein
MAGNLDFSTLMEIASGVINSLKPGENGKLGGGGVDVQKLGITLVGLLGKQAAGLVLASRKRKEAQMDEAIALLRERAGIVPAKKSIGVFPFAVVGTSIGLAIYILRLKSEERAQLFSSLDKLANEITGLVNEFQGKSYTSNYEVKK